MDMTEVFVVGAARTAIGAFGGALRGAEPSDLGAETMRAAVARAGLEAGAVEHVVFGQVIPTRPADAYLARVVAMTAGAPEQTPAMTVNRLCGSGLQAILSAAQAIKLGDCGVAVGGGAEVMSRAPFLLQTARFGQKMGDTQLQDALNGTLTDPFDHVLMGITAENVAERYEISRGAQDQAALESQQRAARAMAEGRFADQIVPIEVPAKGGVKVFEVDEHVRPAVTAEELAAMKPAFRKDGGTVTVGNASGINDGAAAVALASGQAVSTLGLRPLARLVAYGHAGVAPSLMGIGPVPATQAALARAGLTVNDLDVVESNEAFAAQACAVTRQLGLDPAKVNPNGGAIALGHPVGATGAIIVTKLIYELQRSGGRYGLATMCIGGGQGIAAIFERV
jgi:acetyl-CoA C-acetyltransferase